MNFKRYFQFLLIVIAAGSIYPIIYLRTGYQETILQVFDMTFAQLNIIYTVLGFTFVVGYFPSGYLSDKFSAKWLLTISLFATALGGFWFAQIPSYSSVVMIFVIWGFFSVFTFWSAHMKLVKLLSTPEEEGKFFGILDGGRGLIEALLASIAIFIFTRVLRSSGENSKYALTSVIYMYSTILLVVSILIGIFVKTDESKDTEKKEKVQITKDNPVFKNKLVYLLGAIIFMGYFTTWGQFFLGGHLEVNIGVEAVSVAGIMAIFLWTRPIGGMLGGYLADKLGKTKIICGSMIGASISLILMSVLPVYLNVNVFYAIVLLFGLFIFCIRGTYWSLLGDLKISDAFMGLAIGYISFWGYLPDIIAPQISNLAFGNFGDAGGYNAYFIITAVLGLIGAGLCLVFVKAKKV